MVKVVARWEGKDYPWEHADDRANPLFLRGKRAVAAVSSGPLAEPLWQLDTVAQEPARLRDVSLTIPRGVTAVIGGSGAGKTSLLNVLVGFEKPAGGRITGAPRVAWVPQNGGLWPHCTAREHLTIARGSAAGVDELLASFDLSTHHAARPHEMSDQEGARLAVARALAAKAEVLVMDEPLTGVEPAHVAHAWAFIRQHLARRGTSLVFSTRVPETAVSEAAHAVCLRAGRVLHSGPVAALYAEPPDEELMGFLGPGNWLTVADARRWFRAQIAHPRCLRPEQISLTPVAEGPLRVESARFSGTCAEAVLRHVPSNATRTFFHRPPRAELQPGGFVQLTALLGVLLMFS